MTTAAKQKEPTAGPGKLAVTTPSDRVIRTERVFDAPRERVWKAYTDPKLIAQWWGRGNKLDIERHELKVGGHWRFVEHANGESHGFEGRFREVTPPERISMTFEWDGMPGYTSLDTAEFIDMGGQQTKIVTTTLFFSTEERDGMLNAGMSEGLNQGYDALDRVLASMG